MPASVLDETEVFLIIIKLALEFKTRKKVAQTAQDLILLR